MDHLYDINIKKRNRKKIIIAPHHTVKKVEKGLNISNFLEYLFKLNIT